MNEESFEIADDTVYAVLRLMSLHPLTTVKTFAGTYNITFVIILQFQALQAYNNATDEISK